MPHAMLLTNFGHYARRERAVGAVQWGGSSLLVPVSIR